MLFRFPSPRCLGRFLAVSIAALLSGPLLAWANEPPREEHFAHTVKPLLQRYCYDCHNAEKTSGELDLTRLTGGDAAAADAERLAGILEVVRESFMPPEEAPRHPTEAERRTLSEWLSERLGRIAEAHAGDPGLVVIRRLTNAELNYTITDLTGIDRDWTQGFPHDGSGGEGFSNTGQTLQMSPLQIEKYLALAQRLSNHALLLPGSGPVFFDTPVDALPEVERARITLERLDGFCRQHDLLVANATPAAQVMSYAYPDQKQARPGRLSATPRLQAVLQ